MSLHRVLALFLAASALLLGGHLWLRSAPAAHAGMVNGQGQQMLTARTSQREECLFILDTASGRMGVFRCTTSGRDLELISSFDVATDLFAEKADAGGKPKPQR